MSLKATTMSNNNSLNVTSSVSNTSNTVSSSSTIAGVKIKKELPSSDEIKEFAENTMNELLGWYGFDGVDRLDLSAKTSRLLQTAAVAAAAAAAVGNVTNKNNNNNNNNNNTSNNNNNNNNNNKTDSNANTTQQHQQQQQQQSQRRNRSGRSAALLNVQQLHQQQQQRSAAHHMRNISNSNNNKNNKNSSNDNINTGTIAVGASHGRKSTANSCTNSGYRTSRSGNIASGVSLLSGGATNFGTGNESTNSDHDTRSSHEDDSKSPLSAGKSSVMDEKIDNQNCCWCRRPVPENAPDFLTTTDGPRYCSESCFTQSRRASFKKAKTCDWCKHVRHAVSYVDFQDGASQLQFCSDKCLNQYKMQIFCKETQAHLDMNPHLREQGLDAADNGASLITPDLWLRNCRSRSASPASTISVSPGPPTISLSPPPDTATNGPAYAHISTQPQNAPKTIYAPTVQIHKPMISIAPVSKLMSKSPGIMQNRQSPKHSRKKRPLRNALVSNEATASCDNLNLKTSQPNFSKTKAINSGSSNSSSRTSPGGHLLSSAGNVKSLTPTLNQFAGSSVQDLHMSVPPLSPMLEQQVSAHFQAQAPLQLNTNAPTPTPTTTIPSAFFAAPPMGPLPPPPPNAGHIPQPAVFPMRAPFFPNIMPPRFFGASGPMTPMMPGNDLSAFGALFGAPPPVTVMVPYPIILPLPIPIPVPLPIVEFHKAYLSPAEREKFMETQRCLETSEKTVDVSKTEEPLDFTKAKESDVHDIEMKHLEDITTTPEFIASTPVPEEEETISPVNTQLNETDNVTITHCIVPANDSESLPQDDENIAAGHEIDDTHQKLPKFKITRLQTKRTLILQQQQQQTKEAESTRPLRKRKRIIDCDFQKMALKESENVPTEPQAPVERNEMDVCGCETVSNTQINCNSPDSQKSENGKKI